MAASEGNSGRKPKALPRPQAPESGLVPVSQGSGPAPNPFHARKVIAGKYEIIEPIGDGGMGFVLAARHLELGETVALKFLRPEALKNPEIVARFSREARAAARIKSEYVARVFDVGSLPDGSPFIVMEYLAGEDLCTVVEKRGALPYKLAVEYVMQTCEALAAAHSLGIIHRDIKPENLFLARRPQGMDIVKVLDFGVSKVALTGSAFETDLPLIRTMMPMGSPVYMSPEQIRASHEIDARSDIWSLGCVLYELLTGATAFDAPSITQLSAIILEKNPTPVRELAPTTPEELARIVNRCLQKNPEDRYQNVAELAIALYPFAPRRARLSAERCSYMLRRDSKAPQDFELLSVAPPADAMPALNMEQISPVEVLPETLMPEDVEPITDFRPTAKRRRTLIAGVALLALGAAAWVLLSSSGAPAPSANLAPQDQNEIASAVPPAAPEQPTPRQTPEPGQAARANENTPQNAATASAAGAETTRKSRGAARSTPRRTAPATPSRTSSRSRAVTRQNDDVDVGF
ncbi:MAG TPA: serine/threonine-protein kinase [Polyangiaceae bacterium]|nr:serine/threonine-protein kinase [Polyangiaceae bacterium]